MSWKKKNFRYNLMIIIIIIKLGKMKVIEIHLTQAESLLHCLDPAVKGINQAVKGINQYSNSDSEGAIPGIFRPVLILRRNYLIHWKRYQHRQL